VKKNKNKNKNNEKLCLVCSMCKTWVTMFTNLFFCLHAAHTHTTDILTAASHTNINFFVSVEITIFMKHAKTTMTWHCEKKIAKKRQKTF
jgi:hypothetical protein